MARWMVWPALAFLALCATPVLGTEPPPGQGEGTGIGLEEAFWGGIKPRMLWIEPGTYRAGSPPTELGRGGDETLHEVQLTQGFYLAESEITQAQWRRVMRGEPSRNEGCDDCPVESVSWLEAAEYCNALSVLEGLRPAYAIDTTAVEWIRDADGYRLPTEAEWEYACRSETETALYVGPLTDVDCADAWVNLIGWYCGNRSAEGPNPVKQKTPNDWSFYDMSGNVREWCWDYYEFDYPPGPLIDPIGPSSGTGRVSRGGSYLSDARHCRSAGRSAFDSRSAYSYVGLRVARSFPLDDMGGAAAAIPQTPQG